MKNLAIALVTAGFAAGLMAAEDSPLKDEKAKISYGYGMEIGKNLKRQGIEIDADLLAQGLKATLNGDKTLLSDEEVRQTMMAFQQKMQASRMEKQKKEGEEHKTKGEAFLAE